MSRSDPPGKPGIPPRWTTSAKTGVGTSATAESDVWFTISHGIVDEVYYPTLDRANTRDFGLLVSDGHDFFSEEKRHTEQRIEPLAQGVPGYRLTNTCRDGRYRITKTVITDPSRDVLLQHVLFEPLVGTLDDYHLYALLAPHIGNRGADNDGWAHHFRGVPILFAERAGIVMAMACSVPFIGMSCGYVGFSDGWHDISENGKMTWFYQEAREGNIALTGEIDLVSSGGEFVLALGFGESVAEAGQESITSLFQSFDRVVKDYVVGWQEKQMKCRDLSGLLTSEFDLYRVSVAVLKTHEAKRFVGGMIASLSIPWGETKGDDDLGGYHLIWPRDLCESAGGLLAAGDTESARNTLLYLMGTQGADGHWPQNMWIDGTEYWPGVQMDETALPILLADSLRRMDALDGLKPWPVVLRAARYVVRNGPVTQQDRWEEDGGYSPYTLAVEVAALLAAADFAEDAGEPMIAHYLRETADAWNASIERWTYVTGTPLANHVGVEGYYVRISSADAADAASPTAGFVPIKNRPPGEGMAEASALVSPDALALVHFGLRDANDPRMVNTVRVIDETLKTEMKTGPGWLRYNEDGYGEHDDGKAFDGTGVGRRWPLLAGERAHYELAAGNRAEAERLLQTIAAQASDGGLIPEQVWDGADIPERELFNGRPTGSAMPLAWAHAETIKLMRSLHDNQVFDIPPQPVERYIVRRIGSPRIIWRFNQKLHTMPAGKILRIETLSSARIHWSHDGWKTTNDIETDETGLGMYYADLPTGNLDSGGRIAFTFFWTEPETWEGKNFEVVIE
jgi:glucoamylase